MTKIFHLSDLHLPSTLSPEIEVLLASLAKELAAQVQGARDCLVVITGDLFTSAADLAAQVTTARQVLKLLSKAVHGAPIIILPGNHDRRLAGTIRSENASTHFARLAEALHDYAEDMGILFLPFSLDGALVRVLEVSGIPWHADLAVLDTTRLLSGCFSSGGLIRAEDLLLLRSLLPEAKPDQVRPLILLMHHHLVPTPVTDRGSIDVGMLEGVYRFFARMLLRGLGRLVANIDHEEIMMTAMGAGTALSILHSLKRPVLVLHGHKHYPGARLLTGVGEADGDIVLLSAGSAGLLENWNVNEREEKGVPIWPSFNVVTLGSSVSMERVLFPICENSGRSSVRSLAHVFQRGTRWVNHPVPATPNPTASAAALTMNHASYSVEGTVDDGRYDLSLSRWVGRRADSPTTYEEQIKLPGEVRTLSLSMDGKENIFHFPRAICRTSLSAESAHGIVGESYEWVSLLNRYDSDEALLSLRVPPEIDHIFGSVIDIGSGAECPAAITPVSTDAGRTFTIRVPHCPARTLLRLMWPLKNEPLKIPVRFLGKHGSGPTS